jgi:hypothetical protein
MVQKTKQKIALRQTLGVELNHESRTYVVSQQSTLPKTQLPTAGRVVPVLSFDSGSIPGKRQAGGLV